jgi:hypothetical protein
MNTQTNQQVPEDRIRPGFVILLVVCLAAVVAGMWAYTNKRSATEVAGASAVKPTTSHIVATRSGNAAKPTAAKNAAPDPLINRQPPLPQAPVDVPEGVPASALEAKWGIQFCGVAMANNDAVLDLRYKVTSQAKAAVLTSENPEAHLIDLASGSTTPLCPPQSKEWPFAAHSRARSQAMMMRDAGAFPPPPNRLAVGRIYSILLPNPGGAVRSGSLVAVVVGGIQTDNIKVD